MVDGHTIVATNDAITIDGKAQSFDPTQDVEITVDEAGAVQAKTLAADAPRPDEETDEGADAAARGRRKVSERGRRTCQEAVARHLAEQRRPGFLRFAGEAGLKRLLERPHPGALEGVVVARLDAGFALACAQQLEDGLERLEPVERQAAATFIAAMNFRR